MHTNLPCDSRDASRRTATSLFLEYPGDGQRQPVRRRGGRGVKAGVSLFFSVAMVLGGVRSGRTAEPELDLLRSPVTQQRLEARKLAQQAEARGREAFYGFSFADRREESGVTFEHRIVDDAGKDYKAAHYDHGNGVAAADVDGDGLVDLYFTTQLGSNGLWRNLGGGRFEDITGRAGVGLADQISVGASFGDINNDGLPDLFVSTVRHGNRLFRNLGEGRFTDVSKAAGVDYVGHSSGAVFLDFDNDGWLDLCVANVGVYTTEEKGPGGFHRARVDAFAGHTFPERTEFGLLYRNQGDGTFKEVSQAMGLRKEGWFGDVLPTDLNGDRFPDLYFPNMQGDDRYFENKPGKGFVERTALLFPKTPWGATGGRFFDFNQDGLLDLFVTDMHSDMTQQQTTRALGLEREIEKQKSEAYCSAQWTEAYLQGSTNNLFGNAFYKGIDGGRFEEVSDTVGAETYWPWGVSVGDVNADGFEDAFVTSGMGYPFRYAVNKLLLNEGGKRFFDAEFLLGVEPRPAGRLGKVFFTLDCSGPDRTNALCQGKSGLVPVPGSLSSRSSLLVDLDDDGDLDLVTGEFNDRPQLLFSDLSSRRRIRFLKFRLVGTQSNRAGLGALVRVKGGGKTFTQYHDGKSGYLAQSLVPLYFGLGGVTEVASVEVLWPSGVHQIVSTPALNRLHTLVEPR